MTIFEAFRSIHHEFMNQAVEAIISADDYNLLCVKATDELPGHQLVTHRIHGLYGIPITAAPDGTLECGRGLLVSGGEVVRHLEWDALEHEEPHAPAGWLDELLKEGE